VKDANIRIDSMMRERVSLVEWELRVNLAACYRLVGPSIPQAFNLIYWLEQACRIQVDMLSCQRPLHKPPAAVVERTADALSGMEITLDNEPSTNPNLKRGAQAAGSGYGLLEWPALLRSLDRVDSSYRD
jgi:hypothetical protein